MLSYKSKATNHITTEELARYRLGREILDLAREEVRALADVLDRQEKDIIERIELGATADEDIEVITKRRQNISWLTAFKERLGTEAVVEVKNDWPITFYKELRLA